MTEKQRQLTKRLLIGGAGLLMIIGGIIALCNPGKMEKWLILSLGVFSIVSGGCYIVAFMFMRRGFGAGFLLVDGILTVILGILLLVHKFITANPIELLFTALLVLIGISMIRFSVEAKNFGVKRWWVLLAVGGTCIVLGLLALIIPKALSVAASVTAGVMLIAGGLATFVGMFMADRHKDKIITVRERDIEYYPATDEKAEQKSESDESVDKE